MFVFLYVLTVRMQTNQEILEDKIEEELQFKRGQGIYLNAQSNYSESPRRSRGYYSDDKPAHINDR